VARSSGTFDDVPLVRIEPVDVREWSAELTRSDVHANTVAKIALLFTSVKGSPLLSPYFHPYRTKAKVAAGVDADTRFHDLRHLAGTTAASAGASVKEVMARMGHASPDAAIRYLKTSEQRDGEAAERIQARLDIELRDAQQGACAVPGRSPVCNCACLEATVVLGVESVEPAQRAESSRCSSCSAGPSPLAGSR